MSFLLLTISLKWVYPKEIDLDKHDSSISKSCLLEVDLEYPKELC